MAAPITLPRVMRIGAGASTLLPEILSTLGLSRPLILTDRYLLETGRVVMAGASAVFQHDETIRRSYLGY